MKFDKILNNLMFIPRKQQKVRPKLRKEEGKKMGPDDAIDNLKKEVKSLLP